MINARKSTAKFAGLVRDLAKEREQGDNSVDEGAKAREKSIRMIQEISKESYLTCPCDGTVESVDELILADRKPKLKIESSITLGAQSDGEQQDVVPNALGLQEK